MNKILQGSLRFAVILVSTFLALGASAQPFTPVPITGFNQDVVAEAGTSSLTTTTSALDGTTISNKVIYTEAFRTLNAFGGGGLPDNGVITDAAGTYQLADYAASNALIIPRNQTGDLFITTAAQYDRVRLLCFSTEGTSLLNATFHFSDGTSAVALAGVSLGDWFNNTADLVISGFGRVTRATPATGADAFPSNPRMYYIEIPLSCTDRQKNLERINISNVTTAGSNAPFPNAVFMALSATSYALTVSETHVDATCTTTGSATLTVTGSSSAYNVSWNTTPAQTGLTATNLAGGTYTATITDLNNCTSTFDVTILQTNDLTLTTTGDTTICFGASFTPNTISGASTFSWTPTTGVSNPTLAAPVITPSSATQLYTVTGTLGTCTSTASFTVTVDPEITVTLPGTGSICSGASFPVNGSTNATTVLWTPTDGVSNPSIINPVLNPTATTNYSISASTGACSVVNNFTLNVTQAISVNAGANVTIAAGQSTQLQGTAPTGSYSWSPATGLNNSTVLDPVASPTATTIYTLTVTDAIGCTGSDDVQVDVISDCISPMYAITPNGDGINDRWLVSTGSCGIANVRVFNRYGSPVFEAQNYQNNWEGTYKGKRLPDATYYFVIEYRLASDKIVTRKGDLTILR